MSFQAAYTTFVARTGSNGVSKFGHHAQHLKRYGLTPSAWAARLIDQAGRCACCNAAMRKPCVDHCHETGRIRGLLCYRCNGGIGQLGDNAAGLRRALAYLETQES